MEQDAVTIDAHDAHVAEHGEGEAGTGEELLIEETAIDGMCGVY
jgi:mycofactocin precursor